MNTVEVQNKVREIVEPTVQRLGFDLVAVEWSAGVLRLSIDAPSGIGIADCSNVSRRLGPLLDEADPIKGHYHLEVSSPGIERPVQRADDFRRFVGFLFKVRLVEGHPRRRYTGRLARIEGEDIVLVADGAEHSIALDAVERAHLVLTVEEYQRFAEVGLPPVPALEESRDDRQ